MGKITVKEVDGLARLARVGLSEEEKVSLASQMTEILDYARQLDEVDTSDVEPTSQVTGLNNKYRDDAVVSSVVSRDELLANAPDKEHGSIKVKAVL